LGSPQQTTGVVDEVQRVPEFLPVVHALLEHPGSRQGVLAGSSARKRWRGGVTLLAGRALFSAREPLQKPFGFFRAFALERAPDFGIVRTKPVDLRGFVEMGIGINRDAASTEIDPKDAGWGVERRSGAAQLDMQEECAISTLDQCGTGRGLAFELSLLVVAKRGRKACSPVE
jgi:hypothetical protein